MQQERRKNGERLSGLLVMPGEIIVTYDSLPFICIVARGVAVCLWDRFMHFAGICCFNFPHISDPLKATGKYGNVAVLKLISMMRDLNSNGKFQSQLFGGAKKDENDKTGELNIEIARKILNAKGSPIISEDTGGLIGRKILFDGTTGQTAILKVQNLRKEDWEE